MSMVLDVESEKSLKKINAVSKYNMPLEFCIANQDTSFQSTLNLLHGLGYGI